MKKFIKVSKNILRALTSGTESERPQPDFLSDTIVNPDAELGISNDILNELLNQNFPLAATVAVGGGKQVEVSVAAAEIRMKKENELELRITNAAIQYDQTIFKIGLHSNIVAVTLQLGVVQDGGKLRLVAQGWFSDFHIKYLPNWVASRLAEVLTAKLLSPVVDISITEFLSLNKTFATEFITLNLALEPEMVSVRVGEKGIDLQVRFAKLVSSS